MIATLKMIAQKYKFFLKPNFFVALAGRISGGFVGKSPRDSKICTHRNGHIFGCRAITCYCRLQLREIGNGLFKQNAVSSAIAAFRPFLKMIFFIVFMVCLCFDYQVYK